MLWAAQQRAGVVETRERSHYYFVFLLSHSLSFFLPTPNKKKKAYMLLPVRSRHSLQQNPKNTVGLVWFGFIEPKLNVVLVSYVCK